MKIQLFTDTSVSAHYIATLIMLYRPGEKFGLDAPETPVFTLRLFQRGDFLEGMASLCEQGRLTKEEDRRLLSEFSPGIHPAKVLAGQLVLAVFSRVHGGYLPPWGTLTGVRPARFALGFLLEGYEDGEAERLLTESYRVRGDKAALALSVATLDRELLQSRRDREYSLYIGIPFCPTRCRYCSFTSYATPGLHALLPEYLVRLAAETKAYSDTARQLGLPLTSVYVGGGTPTVLSEKQLEEFFEALLPVLSFEKDREFTFEAGRPDTVTQEKLSLLRQAGVNRISINPQTTNDAVLAAVGRGHTAADFFRAFEQARRADFPVINTDLIAGLPGESAESFENSLRDVLRLSPENITVHAFTLKKSSEFTVQGARLSPEDPVIARMLAYAGDTLQQAGYIPYYMYRQKNTGGNFENVGYAREKQHICRYNVDMMEEFHTVLAAGAGASTKLVGRELTRVKKIHNPKYPYEYLREDSYIHKNREEILSFYKEDD